MLQKTKKIIYSAETWDEKRLYAERSLPKLSSTSFGMMPLILSVPLFSVARKKAGAVEVVDKVMRHKGYGSVHYTGPRLSQSHLTVLLLLIHLRQGDVVDNIIAFRPSTYCAKMGWSDNSRNTERLAKILDDLFEGNLRVWGKDEQKEDGTRVRFIAEWKPAKGADWTVHLSPTILRLFRNTPTYLNIAMHKQLSVGMATFLFGFLRASSCDAGFSYEELHVASGSAGVCGDDFKKDIRKQLGCLKALGIIANFEQRKSKESGSVTIKVWKN